MIAPQVTALSGLHLFGPFSTFLGMVGMAPPPGTPNPMLGRNGIILLYAVQHAPIVFITLRAGLARIPRDLVEAARASGARPLSVLWTIVLPAVRPYIVAAAALAFVSGVGNFGIPALLGMPVNYLTLPMLIYQDLSSFGPGVLPQITALSVLALAGVACQSLALRGAAHRFTSGTPARFELGRYRLLLAGLGWLAIGFILVLPACALLATSLVPSFGVPLGWQTMTVSNYAEVLVRQASTVRTFRNSLVFAGAAALILAFGVIPVTAILGRLGSVGSAARRHRRPALCCSRRRACHCLHPLVPAPAAAGRQPLCNCLIIVVAYVMRFFTLALKPVATAVGQISRDLDEAAAVSGAGSPRRLATITAPLAAPAAVAGGLLVFMSAFNELTVSALLWSSGNERLGVVLFSLEEAGLGTQAAAIAVSTIVIVVVLLLVLDWFGRRFPAGVLPWR